MQETEDNKGNGLYCFLSPERACGPDCMAYEMPPTHKDFVGKQWANCMLLVNIHRTGKHLTIIAQAADTYATTKADERRTHQPLPPPVR